MQSLATLSLDSTADDQDGSGAYWSQSVEGELPPGSAPPDRAKQTRSFPS
jgi:hypothetical protein